MKKQAAVIAALIVAVLMGLGICNAGDRVDGSKNVTTAGTAVRLTAAETYACWVVIQAKFGNTDSVFKGAATIDSTRGMALPPGGSVSEGGRASCSRQVRINIGAIWIDAAVSGEGVTFEYMAHP